MSGCRRLYAARSKKTDMAETGTARVPSETEGVMERYRIEYASLSLKSFHVELIRVVNAGSRMGRLTCSLILSQRERVGPSW
jgi:hypothetical protein